MSGILPTRRECARPSWPQRPRTSVGRRAGPVRETHNIRRALRQSVLRSGNPGTHRFGCCRGRDGRPPVIRKDCVSMRV
jgi:hypothetical protein